MRPRTRIGWCSFQNLPCPSGEPWKGRACGAPAVPVGGGRGGKLCRNEEHGGCVFTRGNTGTASDTGGGVERVVGIDLGDWNGVRIDSGAGADVDVAADGDDPVERGAVGDEILDDWKWIGAEWLDPNRVAIAEFAHVYLAGGDALVLGVRDAVDGEVAGSADTLAAIVVKVDGVVALLDDALVNDVEHFEERSLCRNIFRRVGFDSAFGTGTCLAPDFESEVHGAWKRL